MLFIDIKKSGGIERALKELKRKFSKTGQLKELRERQEFVKGSVKRREQIKKAKYKVGQLSMDHSENTQRSAYEAKRQRMEKILEEKRKRLLESNEEKRIAEMKKESEDKTRRIALLEEKVAALEKLVNQTRLDFSRYRIRNVKKGVKG